MNSGKAWDQYIGVFLGISLSILAVPLFGARAAPADLPTSLAQFDAIVLPLQERQAAARMTAEDLQRRLREANDRSSAEWRKITSREEWERFRTAKLAALHSSLGQATTPV